MRTWNTSLEGIDAYFQTALERWQIPGIALSILGPGGARTSRGYGLREIGSDLPVTPETTFTVGSLTKAFVAAGMGLLVEEGRLHWDDPVRAYLSDFELADPTVSRLVTIRDLLAHRVGWEEGYWTNFAHRLGLSESAIVQSLRLADPGRSFRARFVYSNMSYVVAGEIISALSGLHWDEFVRTRILEPLGMGSTTTRAQDFEAAPNRASPHVRYLDGGLRPDQVRVNGWWSMDNHGASGSMNSTAADLLAWLVAQLGEGQASGPSLLPSRLLQAVHAPSMLVPSELDHSAVVPLGYGLGWHISLYRGRRRSDHEGAFRGMSAYAAVLFDRGIGVAVLANSRDAVKCRLTRAFGQWVLDRLLGAPETDWPSIHHDAYGGTLDEDELSSGDEPVADAPNPGVCLDLGACLGAYLHPAYGAWEVAPAGNRFILQRRWGGDPYRSTLEAVRDATFKTVWNDPLTDYWPSRSVTFTRSSDGEITGLRFVHGPGHASEEFRREAESVQGSRFASD